MTMNASKMHLFIQLITLEFLFHFSPQVSSTPLGIVASDSSLKNSMEQMNGSSPNNSQQNSIQMRTVGERSLRELTPRVASSPGKLDTDYIELDFSPAEKEDWEVPRGGFNTLADLDRLEELGPIHLQVPPDQIRESEGPPWSYHDLNSPKDWHELSNKRLLIPNITNWKPKKMGYSEMRFLPTENTQEIELAQEGFDILIIYKEVIAQNLSKTTLGEVSDQLREKEFTYEDLRLISEYAKLRIIELVAKGSQHRWFKISFDIIRVTDAVDALLKQKEIDHPIDSTVDFSDGIFVLTDLENYMTTTNIGTCFQPQKKAPTEVNPAVPPVVKRTVKKVEEKKDEDKKEIKCMDTLTYFQLMYNQSIIFLQDLLGKDDPDLEEYPDEIQFLLDRPEKDIGYSRGFLEKTLRYKEQYEKFSLDDAQYCWWNEQSPLSISTKRAEQSTYSVYEFDENAKKPYRFRMFLPSDGTTLLTVTLEDSSKYLGTGISLKRGGLMGPTLYFERMHIKYSSHQNKSHHYVYGTEHTLDGQGYAMELQLVFSYEGLSFWEPYYFVLARTLKSWKPYRSKMTMILSVFVQVVDKVTENPVLFEPISQAAYQFRLQQERQTGKLYRGFISDDKIFILDDFIPNSVYYLYRGSLTHPPCLPYVMWSIFEKPLQISKKQFLEIITIPARHFDSTDFVADNIRHTKFIKSRLEDTRFHGKKAVRKNRYLRENRIVQVSYMPKGCTSKQHCLDEYKRTVEAEDAENRLSGSQSQYSSFLFLCYILPFFTFLL